MTTAFYRTGKVAVTQGSKVVTGTGTNWATGIIKPLAGDIFVFNNKIYEIDSVTSNTEIRLFRNFEDNTASNQAYMIMRNASLNISSRIAAQVAQVVNQKQLMLDEFENFLTNSTDATVDFTDTLGNKVPVTPVPMLDAAHNQAIADLNQKADDVITSKVLMDASQRQALLDENERTFAASGMVHTGKQQSGSYWNANDGMWGHSNAGFIRLGSGIANTVGTSKTELAVTHIAGVVSSLSDINTNTKYSEIILPPAPDGTVIYDSTGDARGTGKANLNLLTEVDPKYGDVAATQNEAVARAFEGWIKNGDFRSGDDGNWTVTAGGWTVSTSGAVCDGTQTVSTRLTNDMPRVSLGENFILEVVVDEFAAGSLNAILSNKLAGEITGVGTHTIPVLTTSGNEFRLDASTDFIGKVSSVRVYLATEEVVTDRVDMFGLEQFDMVMKDGEIFDMVQSQSTTFGTSGVPTVVSTRPDSFFAAYDGQQNIQKGRCVRWPDLNRAQKRHIAKHMKERLWINEDDQVTFTTIRQRSFAGAGNGDWEFLSSNDTSTYAPSFQSGGKTRVTAQGIQDSINSPYNSGSLGFTTSNNGAGLKPNELYQGCFTAQKNETVAYKGRCFFYVLGTVSRLNQGVYHPLNESGAREVAVGSSAGTISAGLPWHNGNSHYISPKTKAECFKLVAYGEPNKAGAYESSGRIGTDSGRNDGRFYDAIYADGLGGVVDRRLSAWDMGSPEESAKAWEKVKNGTYRGLERLVWSTPYDDAGTGSDPGASTLWSYFEQGGENRLYVLNDTTGKDVEEGDWFYLYDETASMIVRAQVDRLVEGSFFRAIDATIQVLQGSLTLGDNGNGNTVYYILEKELNTSVSGNFTMIDVIGDPANILLTDALKNGWQGSWIPVIPPASGVFEYPLTRKSLDSTVNWLSSVNHGGVWSSWSNPLNTTKNVLSTGNASDANAVAIVPYTAFAKQTKPSTTKPVLNGEAGVGSVWQLSYFSPAQGALLAESTLGVIPVDSTSGNGSYPLRLLGFKTFPDTGNFDNRSRYPVAHSPVTLLAPANNSHAVKALPYQISDNGQCSIGVQANELTYEAPVINALDTTTDGVPITKNFIYKCNGGVLNGRLVRAKISHGAVNVTNIFMADTGKLIDANSGEESPAFEMWNGSGWGDDGTMKITASGSDTFKDLNGNTNLSVSHELALPIGWTKNRARVGKQTSGVDL